MESSSDEDSEADASEAEADARIKKQGETAAQEKENTDKTIAQKQIESDARIELATAVIGKLSELEDNVNKKRLDSINNEISKFAELVVASTLDKLGYKILCETLYVFLAVSYKIQLPVPPEITLINIQRGLNPV